VGFNLSTMPSVQRKKDEAQIKDEKSLALCAKLNSSKARKNKLEPIKL